MLLQTMDAFYEKIADPAHRGAAFFAVCRGKVSILSFSNFSMCVVSALVLLHAWREVFGHMFTPST